MTDTPTTTEAGDFAAVGGPDRPDMPTETRLKLDMRIHRQRLALRENWMIVDNRHWARRVLHRNRFLEGAMAVLRENRDLKQRIADLERRLEDQEAGHSAAQT
jgi:hypothetical protein